MRVATVDPDSPEGRGSLAAPALPVDAASLRGPLSRATIVRAAVTLVDQQGLRELTMRRLGQHLEVEAMALYYHVRGRDDLLDAVVEHVVNELYGDPDVHMFGAWQEFLVRLAHGVRRIALAHPQVFPLIATRPPAAPWIRPPLRSLRWMETFLVTLRRNGFSDSAAITAYRAFCTFLLGRLLLEVADHGVDIGPLESPDQNGEPPLDVTAYPVLSELRRELSEDHSAAEFEQTLETLLDRLERLLPGSTAAFD